METSDRIWPNFEIIQASIHVLIACKYEKDQMKNSGENVMTSFSPLYVYGIFFRRSRAANFVVHGRISPNFELIQALMYIIITCKQQHCEKTYEREGINYFWSIKNSTEILNKLRTEGFQASTISTYDFSTLYTTLPHNLIRNQLVDLIENTFRRVEALNWPTMKNVLFRF